MDEILEKWYDTKEKISLLEKKLEKYKSAIASEMNKKDVDKLSSDNFSITRRRNTRTYMSKDNVPEDIWKKYSVKCSYESFFLKKK